MTIFCNMKSRVVVDEDGLALSIELFLLNSLIQMVQLDHLEIAVNCFALSKLLQVHKTFKVTPNAGHDAFWMAVLLNSRL